MRRVVIITHSMKVYSVRALVQWEGEEGSGGDRRTYIIVHHLCTLNFGMRESFK